MEQTVDDNYVCNLDSASIKKAKDELNEIPDDRLAAVQTLRDWIKEQPYIKCPQADTVFLLRFLRWAKFSQIRAREKLENYLNLRNSIPLVYGNIDSAEEMIQQVIDIGYVVILPERHPNGCQVILVQVDTISKMECKYIFYLRALTAMIEYMTGDEMTQVNGFIILLDFKGATSADISKFATRENAHMIKEWMRCTPGRFKGFYCYSAGIFVEMVITFLRPLFGKKSIERFTVHNTMESVYNHIPKHCLPIEYLPDDYDRQNTVTIQQCKESIKEALLETGFHDDLMLRTSKEYGIDFSKKSSVLVTDHFRKLNVE